MMYTPIVILFAAVIPILPQQDPPERPSKTIPAEIRDRIEAATPSGKALDSRIDASKITELDVPTVPETVLLPAPPVHRIATDRGQTRLDDATWNTATGSTRRGLAWLARNLPREQGDAPVGSRVGEAVGQRAHQRAASERLMSHNSWRHET